MLRRRAILIHAACIGYETEPTFARFAPEQPDMRARIEWEVKRGNGPLRRAIEAEGTLGEWDEPLGKPLRGPSQPKAKL